MASSIVVKQNTRAEQLAADTAIALVDRVVTWSVPKRHRGVASAAAQILQAGDPSLLAMAVHGDPGELVLMWSTEERGFEGEAFSYWSPSKGPAETHQLVERDGDLVAERVS